MLGEVVGQRLDFGLLEVRAVLDHRDDDVAPLRAVVVAAKLGDSVSSWHEVQRDCRIFLPSPSGRSSPELGDWVDARAVTRPAMKKTAAARRRQFHALYFYKRDRISQRSGNRFCPSVVRRYAAPDEPPVPGFAPIVRSTILTWR